MSIPAPGDSVAAPATSAGCTLPGPWCLLALVLLAAGAWLGSLVHLPMPYGLDLVFGTVFAMLALVWLGPWAALAVAGVAGAYTVILWHHPYALVIFVAETAAVALIRARLRPAGEAPPLAAAAGLYWLVLGMPLVVLFYRYALHMSWTEVPLVALKQAINGVLNASLAGALVILVRLARRRGALITVRELLFTILILAILVPALAVSTWQNRRLSASLESEIADVLSLATRLSLSRLRELPTPLDIERARAALPAILAETVSLQPRAAGVTLEIDPDPCCVLPGEAPPVVARSAPGLKMALSERPNASRMVRWRKGQYRMHTPVLLDGPPAQLVAEVAASAVVEDLQRVQLGIFLQLGLVTLAGLIVALLLAHRFAYPIAELAEEAARLPERLPDPTPHPPPARRRRPIALREVGELACALKRMEVALRESFGALEDQRARYRLLVEHQNDLFVQVDRSGRFQYVSPSYLRLFGLAEEALIGHHFMPLVHPDDRAATEAAWGALFAPPHVCVVDQRAWTAQGWRWIQWSDTALLDDAGEVTGVVAIGRDITERKGAERELQQSQGRLARAQRAGRLGIWEYDSAAGKVWFSEEALRLFELPLDDPLVDFEVPASIAHPEDRARMEAVVADAVVRRGSYQLVHRLLFEGGRVKFVSIVGELVDAPGPAVLTGTIRDITAEHRAAEDLARSEARFRAVFERAPIGIALVGEDRRPLYVNPALTRILGRDAATLTGLRFEEFTHPDDADADVRLFAELIAGNRDNYRLVKRYLRPDGSLVWGDLQVALLPVQDLAPMPLALVEDISERRRAEEARAGAEQVLQAYSANLEELTRLAASSGLGGDLLSRLLDFACRVSGCGMAALGELADGHYLGLAVAGPLTRPDAPLPWPDAAAPAAMDRGHPELTRGLAFHLSFEVDWSDAEHRPHRGLLELADRAVVPSIAAGELQILRLVVQRVAAELREQSVVWGLVAARQREVIGHLAGGVAHDFNNVLGAVAMNLQALERLLPAGSAGAQQPREVLEETRAAIDQAKVVTSGLLSLRQDLRLPLERCDLGALVESFIPLLRRLLPPRVSFEVDVARDVEVRTHPAMLRAALLNLVLNARDALGGQGRLELRVAADPQPADDPPDVGRLGAGAHAVLEVADTGCGMTPEVRAHIFEPLFSTKGRGRGGGLGLFMVRELVQRSSGALWVESAPGEGSRFRLLLPEVPGAEPRKGARRDNPPAAVVRDAAERARVLIVDDDAALRVALARRLVETGYLVESAGNGVEALERVADGPPLDLVLSDIAMPGLDGLALYGALCCDYPELPVILMTGDALAAADAASLESGLTVLHKPLDEARLMAAIRAALARAPSADAS